MQQQRLPGILQDCSFQSGCLMCCTLTFMPPHLTETVQSRREDAARLIASLRVKFPCFQGGTFMDLVPSVTSVPALQQVVAALSDSILCWVLSRSCPPNNA